MSDQLNLGNRKSYPGLVGNPFDRLIHTLDRIESIPTWLFFLLISIIPAVRFYDDWLYALIWLGFFILDWILIRNLPVFKISFGPAKPPTLILAFLRLPFTFFAPFPALVFQILGTLMIIYGFWIEPHRLRLTVQRFSNPLSRTNSPIRLVHLGDLHMERSTKRERRILELINTIQPDLIVFSGDVLNLSYIKDATAWQEARNFLSNLHAPEGVFVVTGSPAVEIPEDYPKLIQGLPLTWLKDQVINLNIRGKELELMGLGCTHQPHQDFLRLINLVRDGSNGTRILLYHSPDLAPMASTLNIGLQLSGHTHGGQVRLPFYGALFTGCLLGKRYESGRYQLGKMTLYVTRGIGMEGAGAPRVRFLCPPEITLWEIYDK